jgi:predicted outer membrane repeat protein
MRSPRVLPSATGHKKPPRFPFQTLSFQAFTPHAAAALAAALMVAFAATPGLARTIHVDSRGMGEAPNIQAAVKMGSPGDTVLLANGAYRGPGNRDIALSKPLTISSASDNPDSCVIDCEGAGRAFVIDSPMGTDLPHVNGITITNGHADTGGAVYCAKRCSPLLSRCVFRGNRAGEDGGAIRCAETTEKVHLVDCVFTHNSAGGKGGAIALCCCSLSRFENLTLVDNESKENGAAISSIGLSNLDLERSIVAFHRGPAPIHCNGADAMIDSCDVFGNEGGNWAGSLDSLANRYGNVSLDPGFENAQANNFRLRESSPLRRERGGQRIGAAL